MRRFLVAFSLAVALSAVAATQAGAAALVPLAPSSSWGSAPIFATSPPGDPRVFVVERGGAIRIVNNGSLLATPFLKLPDGFIQTDGERGMPSIAFPPDYASSGLFYSFEAVGSPNRLQVLEYHVSADPNVADLSSRRVVLSVEDDSDIHNSGQLAFGPDGYLYITIGDDADASKGQATDTLDGKILRIDPRKNGASGYTVPGDNPFVGNGAFLPEIWAYGFRNPFRASFTPSGQFVIGEVGNGSVEEVDIGAAGANYGWNVCEGPCDPLVPGFTEPIYSYPHAGSGCRGAIIGGVYVADPTLTGYTGRYLFGDYCFATFGTLSLTTPGGDYQPAALTIKSPSLDSFGTDSKGCVYVMADSTAYRLAANAGDGPACPLTSAGSGDLPGAAAKPQILGSKLRASSKRWVKVHVYCAATANCTGRVTIRSARRIRSHGKLTTLTFGTTVYKNLAQRSSRGVRVTLKKDAFKFLKRRGKIRVKVTATSKSAASPATASASKALSLYAPKH